MVDLNESTKRRAMRMLERRDYARGELIDKLVQKGEVREDAEAVADRLCELRLIDDARYARMVVRHYNMKGYGAARIKDELRRRYVDRELWDEAMTELCEEESRIDAVLRSKLRDGDIEDRDVLRRATDALRRRGYSWSEIKEATEKLKAEREQD